jgi:hypothetical protein
LLLEAARIVSDFPCNTKQMGSGRDADEKERDADSGSSASHPFPFRVCRVMLFALLSDTVYRSMFSPEAKPDENGSQTATS